MKKKVTYSAPEMEVFEVRLESMINASFDSATKALGNSNTEATTEYNEGEVVSW
ncbi:MAG: hypothetical protein K6A94_01510 [Bacteroidales bacterium]|nr:hypothetical protein [Bacteroidales bacterium]